MGSKSTSEDEEQQSYHKDERRSNDDDNEKIQTNLEKIQLLNEYIQENRDLWISEDLLWIKDIPIDDNSEWRCHKLFTETVNNRVYEVFSKKTGTNPKTVFYYWGGHPIQLKFFDAIDFFTLLIKETYHWTPIFTR